MSHSQNPNPEEVFKNLFNQINFTDVLDIRKAIDCDRVYTYKHNWKTLSYKDEKKTLFNMFDRLMIMRENKGKYFSQSQDIWMINYFRDKKKHKKNEEFSLEIILCPISKHHYIVDKGKYD